MRLSSSLLLLSLGSGLGWSGNGDSNGGLLVLGNRKSFTLGSETVEHVTALSASESIGMVSHVGGNLALVAFGLQPLDLAASLDVVVLEQSKGSLLVLVLYFLGLGVHLLLSLSLAAVKGNKGIDRALSFQASLVNRERLVQIGGTEDKSIDGVLNALLNLRSKARDKVASLNIDRELLASGTVHENLHFLLVRLFL